MGVSLGTSKKTPHQASIMHTQANESVLEAPVVPWVTCSEVSTLEGQEARSTREPTWLSQ